MHPEEDTVLLSEIIEHFQERMRQHGDAEVCTCTGHHRMAPASVRVTYVPCRLPLCYDIEVELDGPEVTIALTENWRDQTE